VDKTVAQTKASARSPEQRAADEMIKLIIKLRWMGLEEEADCIQGRSRHFRFGLPGA
jgi:hypothetical protein